MHPRIAIVLAVPTSSLELDFDLPPSPNSIDERPIHVWGSRVRHLPAQACMSDNPSQFSQEQVENRMY